MGPPSGPRLFLIKDIKRREQPELRSTCFLHFQCTRCLLRSKALFREQRPSEDGTRLPPTPTWILDPAAPSRRIVREACHSGYPIVLLAMARLCSTKGLSAWSSRITWSYRPIRCIHVHLHSQSPRWFNIVYSIFQCSMVYLKYIHYSERQKLCSELVWM